MLTTIKIVGRDYPMSFSLMASKKIAEKYGSTDAAMNKISSESSMTDAAMNVMVDILELLISQGCAYKNYFEKDAPIPENAPVIEGKWTPLPREALEIALTISDIEMIGDKVMECISNGNKKEIIASVKNPETRRE